MEAEEVWDFLHETGFLHALHQAHEEATLAVLGALSRNAGFKERSYGTSSFDVFESRLDRVFHIGEDPAPGDPLRGQVVRDDLNGSPGWRLGKYRVLLKRHRFGEVHVLRWDRDSPTKQDVARQTYTENPQMAFDFGDSFPLPPEASEVVTLVAAHSAAEAPLELELFVGRPRFNSDGGEAWWWVRKITPEALGPDPRKSTFPEQQPLWADPAEDVPVLLRDHKVAGQRQHTLSESGQ
ncbi:hypothetical protein [Nonomuraea sp. NPDC050643]|uniref:hypothetical protein n=1 Tax=Nonomuraea sp. NPDC050643 TaxID=3155660 RepID=UPI0033DBA221